MGEAWNLSKFCPECGTKLPDAAAFCGNCGKDVRRSVVPVAPTPAAPASATSAPASTAPATHDAKAIFREADSAARALKRTVQDIKADVHEIAGSGSFAERALKSAARDAESALSAQKSASTAPKSAAPKPKLAEPAPKSLATKPSVPKQISPKSDATKPNLSRLTADSYKIIIASSESRTAAQVGTFSSFTKAIAGFFSGKYVKSLLGCGAVLLATGLMGMLFVGGAIASLDDKKVVGLLPAVAPQKPCVSINNSVPADLAPGDFVTFGRYPQGIDGAIHSLQWRVLENDGQTVLLWSRYGIDARPFDYYDGQARWEASSLRRWLGTVFINKAFTPSEQELIAVTANINFLADLHKNYFDEKTRQEYEKALVDSEAMAAYATKKTYGAEEKSELGLTNDKIFLLSYDEVKYYLDEKEKRYVYPSAASLLLGAQKSEQGLTNCWLRSTSIKDWVCYLKENGDMDNLNALKTCSVVPALRLKIK